MVSELLLRPPGSRVVLLGNEAIARGVIESGIGVVSGYPGTPSSEVIASLAPLASRLGIYVEWAVNEKVGFEIALGAAFAGVRSMATMKAPGLNVALDSVVSAAYSGVDAGCIIYVADDPGPHTTQTEQDSRWLADLAKLPMIEPSTPQEAKDFVKLGIRLSEHVKLPVVLRCTTRVSHATGDVVYGDIERVERKPRMVKDIQRYVRASMVGNRERHRWVLEQLREAEHFADILKLNSVYGDGKLAVVTSGVAFTYVFEIAKRYNLLDKLRIVKLGLVYPLPRNFIMKALEGVEKALVIEELDPYIETKLRALVQKEGFSIKISGKDTGIPELGELDPHTVAKALSRFLETDILIEIDTVELSVVPPPRPPPMCPGCPHRYSYIALLRGIRKAGFSLDEVPIMGDIGCYALSYEPPLEAIWSEHAMGASIGLALGLKASGYPRPVIAVIGDSTLFHAGIPPAIEAVHKRLDIIIVVLDNDVVAMTGHQSTPAWSRTESGRETKPIDIVEVLRSIGIDRVEVADPRDLNKAVDIVTDVIKDSGKPRAIVFRAPCALMEMRRRGGALGPVPKLNEAQCRGCLLCIAESGCPALTYTVVSGKRRPVIIESLCNGCGLCVQLCPYGALIQDQQV